jgi:hypothetical protein
VLTKCIISKLNYINPKLPITNKSNLNLNKIVDTNVFSKQLTSILIYLLTIHMHANLIKTIIFKPEFLDLYEKVVSMFKNINRECQMETWVCNKLHICRIDGSLITNLHQFTYSIWHHKPPNLGALLNLT